MILVPCEGIPEDTMAVLNNFFLECGFRKIVLAEAAEHDSEIAYTSQLCHIVSSAYLRDPLALSYDGFSAGSFRDMIRVGAPDPYLWSELFLDNSAALMPVLDRFIGRMTALRDAIAANDRDAIWTQLSEGRPIKAQLASGGGKAHWTSAMKRKEPRPAATLPKSAEGGEEWVVPS
jgi:prephenate dehydrogenase